MSHGFTTAQVNKHTSTVHATCSQFSDVALTEQTMTLFCLQETGLKLASFPSGHRLSDVKSLMWK